MQRPRAGTIYTQVGGVPEAMPHGQEKGHAIDVDRAMRRKGKL